jgi:hypothetical protein
MVALLLAMGIAAPAKICGQTKTAAFGPVGTVWGGQHVVLEVTDDGVTLEFDCANGSITKTVALGSHGEFSSPGTYTQEHPGPISRDGNPSVTATYSGSIQGNTLKLTITTSPNEIPIEYVLFRGKPGRVVKCR